MLLNNGPNDEPEEEQARGRVEAETRPLCAIQLAAGWFVVGSDGSHAKIWAESRSFSLRLPKRRYNDACRRSRRRRYYWSSSGLSLCH